ncbi:uncharacterized protein CCOS01_06480 [Colletotrichum costaricense]|uniref:Uncharacterized protein n=1 Tax=Colletotrichum costaricense TaxID=1209916 RepID=A0AAI9YYK2_9PEZI|nr:uncharacterized protein CCOS01_06480 [Colletotrichum costaricense]KAK1528646.1 hypothetical protein CCOS01_06480 [Colletotrichum costaricense]
MDASIFIEEGPAIQIATRRCADQLRDMIRTTHRGKTALRELQQRFQAWENNAGVFAEPQLCLDARLSDHKPPQLIILNMLRLIQRNLETGMVTGKFPDIPDLLKTQLIRSMIYRRQRLNYECDRRERQYNTHAGEDHTSAWHDDEKASTYHQSIFNEGYEAMQSERASSISTAATATETEIQYPRQPKAETSEDITRKSQSQHNMEALRVGVDDEDAEDEAVIEGSVSREEKDGASSDDASNDVGMPVADPEKTFSKDLHPKRDIQLGANEVAIQENSLSTRSRTETKDFWPTDVITHRYGMRWQATKKNGIEMQLPRRLLESEIEDILTAFEEAETALVISD